jgi:hypothetical protein
MLLFALVRAIEVMREAASKVSQDARRNSPEIPWSLIVSMRKPGSSMPTSILLTRYPVETVRMKTSNAAISPECVGRA